MLRKRSSTTEWEEERGTVRCHQSRRTLEDSIFSRLLVLLCVLVSLVVILMCVITWAKIPPPPQTQTSPLHTHLKHTQGPLVIIFSITVLFRRRNKSNISFDCYFFQILIFSSGWHLKKELVKFGLMHFVLVSCSSTVSCDIQ